MKKSISLLLAAVILLSLCACSREENKIAKPVNFYYRNAEVSYGSDQGLIAPQISESAGFDNTVELLNEYLKGPSDSKFATTFPASTKVLQLFIVSDRADLQMNDSLSRLTGIDLTIACACLTLTTIELTGVSTVTISASNELLDGNASITTSLDTLMLLDVYEPESTE